MSLGYPVTFLVWGFYFGITFSNSLTLLGRCTGVGLILIGTVLLAAWFDKRGL